MNAFPQNTDNRILRLDKVLPLIGMGRSWVYSAMKSGDFPHSVKLGARAIGWRQSDIDAWLSERKSA